MNKSLKYKLDNVESFSFLIGAIIITFTARIAGVVGLSQQVCYVIMEGVVCFFAALFGPIIGSLMGFVGTVCYFVITGTPIVYVDSISFLVLGFFIGQFANRYGIREGKFDLKSALLFYISQIAALLSAFVFVRPILNFLVNKDDLFDALSKGMQMTGFCALTTAVLMIILFFIISRAVNIRNSNPKRK